MNEQLHQIGERLRGLRDALDIPAQEVADLCGLPLETYERVERGEADITISKLMTIANHYGVTTEALIFDEEPHTGHSRTMYPWFVSSATHPLTGSR